MRKHICFKKTLGLSIVEVMVSIAIGIILTGGILQLYVNNKQSFRNDEAISRMQEDARFLVNYLSRQTRISGFRTQPPITQQVEFPSMESIFTVGNEHISASNNTGVNGSDVLTIRYQGSGDGVGTADGTIRDCLNAALDANDMGTNVLSISANNQLQCRAINATTGTDTTLAIVDNVENFQVLFGEDTTGDKIPDRYVDPDYVGLNLNNVTAIRLGFLLRSDDNIRDSLNTNTYNILGTVYNPTNDRRLRSLFTTTIQLRNIDVNNK